VVSTAFSSNNTDNYIIIHRYKTLTRKIKQRRPPSKKKKRGKPKPELKEGMPQRQHCPLEKRRGDRNPECHEEQEKDVA
jgi:hypothetical protein